MKAPFLKWALAESIFGCLLVSALILYNGNVHIAAKIGGAAVLLTYILGSLAVGRAAWGGKNFPPAAVLALDLLPMIAIAGVVSGWLIALSGSSTADVQQKILGASSGLAVSFLAACCIGSLMVQEYLVGSPKKGGCGCGSA